MKFRANVLVILFGVGLSFPGTALARGMAGHKFSPLKGDLYVGLISNWASLKGDFDGQGLYAGSGKVVLVPKIESGMGVGISFGGRYRIGVTGQNALGGDIQFIQSRHKASWMGVKGNAALYGFGFSGTWHLFSAERVQPFVKLVFGALNLSYSPDSPYEAANGKFNGQNLSYGGGISFFLSEHVSFDFGGQSVSAEFDSIGGQYDKASLDPALKSKAFNLGGGVSFRFKPPNPSYRN